MRAALVPGGASSESRVIGQQIRQFSDKFMAKPIDEGARAA
jgi:hypothetical protein